MSNNKKYYKKNYYKNNKNKKEDNKKENKITYDDLINAKTVISTQKEEDFSKLLIIKYIAITVVLFAIIFGSLLLFRKI